MTQNMEIKVEEMEAVVAPSWKTDPRLWYDLGMDGMIDLIRMAE